MELNRLIAKRADLLRFNKQQNKQKKKRKEPQNFIMDYILLMLMFVCAILFIIFLTIGVFLT